jgi:hypothetical protein
MYRDSPANELDSGWRFIVGDEDDSFLADPSNHSVYDLNTIANFDPDIVGYLDEPVGSQFAREADGVLKRVHYW